MLGNAWTLKSFEPLEDIPSTVRLTVYHSGTTSSDRSTVALQQIVDGVAAERYRPNIQRRSAIDEMVAAHRFMEENRGTAKGEQREITLSVNDLQISCQISYSPSLVGVINANLPGRFRMI